MIKSFPATRVILCLACSCWSTVQAQGPAPRPVVDLAIERMGGMATLQAVTRVRFEQMTLWHRQTFEDRPYGDVVGSYERVTDLRDYSIPAWRNTRRFVGPTTGGPEIVDLVRDSVAARLRPAAPNAPLTWGALNIAYVDERRELFAFAPERLLLLAATARDLRSLPDTSIDGVAHARVQATIDRFPSTVFVRQTDGMLAMVRYRANHPNDFGLAPYGEMEVEVWFGAWRSLPVPGTTGIRYPTQWDISRIGRPYKRITILGAKFDVAATPDSFVVTDAVRTEYQATATRPMWDLSLDSARVMESRFALLGAQPGFSPTAVKVGRRWVLLEGSSVPARTEQEHQWLVSHDQGSGFGAMLMTVAGAPRGSIAWFADKGLPVYLGRGAQRGAKVVLANWKAKPDASRGVERGRWAVFDGDSLWVEPFDAPGTPGGLIAWVPSLRWVYQALAVDPIVQGMVMDHAKRRGWKVERLGHARTVNAPAPATR